MELDQATLDALDTTFGDFKVNGVHEIGIAAGVERIHVPEDSLCVGKSNALAGYSAFLSCHALYNDRQDVLRAIVAAAMQIKHFGWHDDTCNVRQSIAQKSTDEYKEQYKVFMHTITKTDEVIGVSMLAACKINWWQTDHNVGQREFMGYIRKFISAKFGDACVSNRDVYECVWKAAHWISTRGVLGSMGMKGIDVTLNDFPSIAADVKLRVNSFPAGAAKVGVCLAVIRRLSTSMFRDVVPPPPNYIHLLEIATRIAIDPVPFHQGCNYLKPGTGRLFPELDEELVLYCAAYVHSMAAKSTLANARVLPGKDAVRDHPLFSLLTSLNTQINKGKMNTDEALAKMSATHNIGDTFYETFRNLDRDLLKLLTGSDTSVPVKDEAKHPDASLKSYAELYADFTEEITRLRGMGMTAEDRRTAVRGVRDRALAAGVDLSKFK